MRKIMSNGGCICQETGSLLTKGTRYQGIVAACSNRLRILVRKRDPALVPFGSARGGGRQGRYPGGCIGKGEEQAVNCA